MKLSHKAIASNPKLALDWLIMQGYTRKAAQGLMDQVQRKKDHNN